MSRVYADRITLSPSPAFPGLPPGGAVDIYAVPGDPNGVLTAAQGSLALQLNSTNMWLDKTLKSTKFWAAVGTTATAVGAIATGEMDTAQGVTVIAGIWFSFIIARGWEDAAVKGAAAKAKKEE